MDLITYSLFITSNRFSFLYRVVFDLLLFPGIGYPFERQFYSILVFYETRGMPFVALC